MLLSVSVTRQNVEFGNPGSLYLALAFISFPPNLNKKQKSG